MALGPPLPRRRSGSEGLSRLGPPDAKVGGGSERLASRPTADPSLPPLDDHGIEGSWPVVIPNDLGGIES